MYVTPALHVSATDPSSGLDAHVVVDSLVGGRAMGGIRMTADVTPKLPARLALQMTYKLALAGIPIGGARAGIVNTAGREKHRTALLAEFGRRMTPILNGGIYLGSDQGISNKDQEFIVTRSR